MRSYAQQFVKKFDYPYFLDSPEANAEELDKLDPVAEAEKLKRQFEELLVFILESMGDVDLDVLKLRIAWFFNSEIVSTPDIREISDTLQSITTPQNVLNFLILRKFVGYLNFELITAFQKALKSDELKGKIEEYEKNHIAFLKLFSFNAIIEAFTRRPDLGPVSIIGLPNYKVRLQKPWDGRSVYAWKEVFEKKSMSNWPANLIIAHIEKNCIVLVYTVLPWFTSACVA